MCKNKKIASFLSNLFEDRERLIETFGSSIMFDTKKMLIADALSENIELLSEIIREDLDLYFAIYTNNNQYNKKAAL